MKLQAIQNTVPGRRLLIQAKREIDPAIALSANNANEKSVFVVDEPQANPEILQASYTPDATLTGAANGGVLYFNLWRAGVQVGLDGYFGHINAAGVSTLYNQAKGVTRYTSAVRGARWIGSTSAIASSDTGGTLTALAQSALTSIITATSTLVFDAGTANEEVVVLTALNTGTGVFTIAGAFAKVHAAGATAVIAQAANWLGTTTALTTASTGGTLTAVGASALTSSIAATSALTFEPGTANQETIALATLNTGTGVYTFASGVTPKFAHASGSAVIIPSDRARLQQGDVVYAKWQQGSTGLALPIGLITLNYGIAGAANK